ncbi:hypothetical protein NECAME_00387 [Necator americanus]|uniref:ABC transmembrane type-1 domain-containing protein n=1 Tax=Necator americanus TaxID=51031 RepID=W2TAX9_NECAM|nr:hypothetical protein NECAME_00387 [Necator americanus]ETN79013.1 hypothetical protein NECAME_00387 [Necator americanus]
MVRQDVRTSGVVRRSVTSLAVQQIETTGQNEQGAGILRVYCTCLRSRVVFWIALVAGILRGMEMPLSSFFVGFMFRALNQTKDTYVPTMWVAVAVFIGLGVYSWIFLSTSVSFGGWTGEVVTSEMCVGVLKSLLSQDAEFFDRPKRSNAACVAELVSKAQDVQACLDYRFMLMLNNLVALIACIILSLVACWPSGVANTIMIVLVTAGLWVAAKTVSMNLIRKSELDKTTEKRNVFMYEERYDIQYLLETREREVECPQLEQILTTMATDFEEEGLAKRNPLLMKQIE